MVLKRFYDKTAWSLICIVCFTLFLSFFILTYLTLSKITYSFVKTDDCYLVKKTECSDNVAFFLKKNYFYCRIKTFEKNINKMVLNKNGTKKPYTKWIKKSLLTLTVSCCTKHYLHSHYHTCMPCMWKT